MLLGLPRGSEALEVETLPGTLGDVACDAQPPNVLAVPEAAKEVRVHGARPV